MFITCSGCPAAYSCTDSETCLKKDMVNQPDDKGYIKKFKNMKIFKKKWLTKNLTKYRCNMKQKKFY